MERQFRIFRIPKKLNITVRADRHLFVPPLLKQLMFYSEITKSPFREQTFLSFPAQDDIHHRGFVDPGRVVLFAAHRRAAVRTDRLRVACRVAAGGTFIFIRRKQVRVTDPCCVVL